MTVYAVADKVPEDAQIWFKEGMEYEVIDDVGDWFYIEDSMWNIRRCAWEGDALLNGGNWRRVEK